jgi:hypothetical protein
MQYKQINLCGYEFKFQPFNSISYWEICNLVNNINPKNFEVIKQILTCGCIVVLVNKDSTTAI